MFNKIFLIAVSFIMASSLAIAQGKKSHGDNGKSMQHGKMECPMMKSCPMMGGHIDTGMLKKHLALTEEQASRIDALLLAQKKEMLKYKEELSPKSIKLERLLLEEPVNLDEVKGLVMDIARIHGEMHMSMIANRLELEKVLTPAQRLKFKSMHGPKDLKKKDGKMMM